MKTFCRLGYEKTFATRSELDEYLKDNNFKNVQFVEFKDSKVVDYCKKEYGDTELSAAVELLPKKDLSRYVKGNTLLVIEKDDCDDEADFGLEFVFESEIK